MKPSFLNNSPVGDSKWGTTLDLMVPVSLGGEGFWTLYKGRGFQTVRKTWETSWSCLKVSQHWQIRIVGRACNDKPFINPLQHWSTDGPDREGNDRSPWGTWVLYCTKRSYIGKANVPWRVLRKWSNLLVVHLLIDNIFLSCFLLKKEKKNRF